MIKKKTTMILAVFFLISTASPAVAWYEETHLAVAKAAGYRKWYNAAAADIAKAKMGSREGHNHYHMSPHGTIITPEMVFEQARRYDRIDPEGHLYGAIIASFKDYLMARRKGRYAENQMAYLIHYVGDLSMPLHHLPISTYSSKYHAANDGIIEDQVLANLKQIRVYDLSIESERELAVAVARIANLSKALGQKLEREGRLMTQAEAYAQITHSASVLKAILRYARSIPSGR
jgi:hypothetical protein